jgi:hypothetical protein
MRRRVRHGTDLAHHIAARKGPLIALRSTPQQASATDLVVRRVVTKGCVTSLRPLGSHFDTEARPLLPTSPTKHEPLPLHEEAQPLDLRLRGIDIANMYRR